MPDFTAMLEQLHENASLVDDERNIPIIVNKFRQFEIPREFNKVVAFEGDVNSQIISFQIPRFHESHDLSLCAFKKLKWFNRNAGTEGRANLLLVETTESYQLLQWRIPPEAALKSGTLGLSIILYDIFNGKIAFSWNTPVCEQLTISASDQEVSLGTNDTLDNHLPSKNEILYIDLEKKTISAPPGFNFTIANYGDIDTSEVYFQVNRFLKEYDLSQAEIIVSATFKNELISTEIKNKFMSFVNESNDGGLLTFVWSVPKEITYNTINYIGKINISVTFYIDNKTKIWRSNKFTSLQIGESILDTGTSPFMKSQQYIIDGNLYDYNLPKENLPGVAILRNGNSQDIQLNRNELFAEYDDEGNYLRLKIATEEGQTVEQAQSILDKEFLILLNKYLLNTDIVIDGNV